MKDDYLLLLLVYPFTISNGWRLAGRFSINLFMSEWCILIGLDHRDTVLLLVEIKVLLYQLSYAINTQLKAQY